VGKSHRLPSFPSESVYTSPLELIFSDLWDPAHVSSINGFSYYITFVDAYSRFTWIYLLKTKSETSNVFQKFKAMAELQFNSKIKSLQTDWGGEFTPLKSFLADCGIQQTYLSPHPSSKWGCGKKTQTYSGVRSNLHHASLPLKFWDSAFCTALYLINRLPTISLKFEIPYHVLF